MNTIQLFAILMAAVLFLSGGFATLNAQSMKDTLNSSSTNTKPLSKNNELNNSSAKFGNSKFTPNTNAQTNWIKTNNNQEYTRGTISTH